MTTRPTVMADIAVGAVLGAAQWNVNALQQARWTQEVIAGTNADKIPGAALSSTLALPGTVSINGDANWFLSTSGGNPLLSFDTGDFMYYDRAGNQLVLQVGASNFPLILASTGKFTGKGFFDSGEVGIATNATALIAHGLGAIPRFVGGGWSGTSGAAKSNPLLTQAIQTAGARSELQVIGLDSTNIQVHNWDSVTRYVQIFAQL